MRQAEQGRRNALAFGSSEFIIETRPGSTVELVNNIFHGDGEIFCSSSWNIRYNDFYNTVMSCSLDVGNIDRHGSTVL